MNVGITVVPLPFFFDRVDVESFPLLTIDDNFLGGSSHRKIHAEAWFITEDLFQNGNVVLFGESDLDKLIAYVWRRDTNRVDDDKFVIGKMPFEEGNKALADRTIAYQAYSTLYVVINCILLLISIH